MKEKFLVSQSKLWICLFLATAIIIVFGRAVGHNFTNYDDNRYVTENGMVLAGLTWRGVAWAFTSTHAANWHPLTWISHMFDVQLFGLKAGGHHFTSIVLHTIATILLFLAFARMTGFIWRSAFVALLFGIHPLHVESVAWVAERKDVLAAVFGMLALLAYIRYVQCPKFVTYLWVVVFFAMGLLAKPMLVTLPFVFLLLDFWPLGRTRLCHCSLVASTTSKIKTLVSEKLPLFVFSALACTVTYIVQQKGGAVTSTEQFPLGIRIENALVAYVAYIGKMIWPQKLAVFYPRPVAMLPTWQVIGAGIFLAAVTSIVIIASRGKPYLATGWFWYLGTLVPVIGIVQVGAQAMADRYTYIPLIGLFVMIAWGIPDLVKCTVVNREADEKKERGSTLISFRLSSILPFAAGLVVFSFITCAYIQVGYWRDSVSLFTHTLASTSNNALAHNNLGLALADKGEISTAIRHYRRALEIKPDFPLAHNNIGLALVDMKRFDEAVSHFKEALKSEPRSAVFRSNYGTALVGQGNLREAIEQFKEALRINPDYAAAHTNIGLALAKLGEFDKAILEYEKSLKLNPRDVRTILNLGVAFAMLGKFDKAIEVYQKALALNPKSADIHNNLGLAYASQGKIDEALEHYQEAIRIQPSLGQAHYNIAVVLAMKGQYAEAWREVHLSTRYGYAVNPAFVQALSQRMANPWPAE